MEQRIQLREIPRIRQRPGELRKRWFSCPTADLYVWQDEEGQPQALEFCYDKDKSERSLRWTVASGLSHTAIDDGEPSPLRNDAPIAVPDGRFDAAELAMKFESVGARVEPRIYRFVLGLLYRSLR